jgi:hypothetical protein
MCPSISSVDHIVHSSNVAQVPVHKVDVHAWVWINIIPNVRLIGNVKSNRCTCWSWRGQQPIAVGTPSITVDSNRLRSKARNSRQLSGWGSICSSIRMWGTIRSSLRPLGTHILRSLSMDMSFVQLANAFLACWRLQKLVHDAFSARLRVWHRTRSGSVQLNHRAFPAVVRVAKGIEISLLYVHLPRDWCMFGSRNWYSVCLGLKDGRWFCVALVYGPRRDIDLGDALDVDLLRIR